MMNYEVFLKQISLPNIFRSHWLVSAGRVVVLTVLAKSIQTSSACTETVCPTAGGSRRLAKAAVI
jgi:hypothetical protein